jgi:hypothetical protein
MEKKSEVSVGILPHYGTFQVKTLTQLFFAPEAGNDTLVHQQIRYRVTGRERKKHPWSHLDIEYRTVIELDLEDHEV